MAFTAIVATNPLAFDLTFEACAVQNIQPLYVGSTVAFRFQLRDYDDDAVSLTGATITMIITDGTTTITLTCTKDGDQAAETGDTGKGWYEALWPDDHATIATVAGRRRSYHTKILQGDGTTILPHFKGKIDVGV